MECCASDLPLQTIAVYGPRRTGTNYIQQLSLLNTLNCQSLNLDASQRNHNCRLLVNGYSEYGSKHSLRDREIQTKISAGNINIVILKKNIRLWLYSRLSYQQTFCSDRFRLTPDVLRKWVNAEYVDFLQDLSKADPEHYRLIFYEDLSVATLRSILKGSGALLTRYPVELESTATPGGGNNGRKFQPRIIGGNDIIENFVNSNPALDKCESPEQMLSWGAVT